MNFLWKIFGKNIDIKKIEREALEYKVFKSRAESKKDFNYWFEKACHFSERLISITPSKSMRENLREAIITTDLNVTPTQVFSLTILSIVASFIVILPIMLVSPGLGIFIFFMPFVIGYLLLTYPSYLAIVTKIRASDETIKAILYMVIYLRLNPHLEGAVAFAAEHCRGPIGTDLKKIIWDLESGKYNTIERAIASKIDKWLIWDKEFVESINLITAVRRETTPEGRERTLDKALSYILESTYEKMKDYNRGLRIPLTLIHTMGITFPLMGLVMFPMIAIFLHDQFNPYYLGLGYIFILPSILYFYLRRTISKRPGAFSFPDISHHPDLPPRGKFILKIGDRKYLINVVYVAIIVGFFISIPGITHLIHLASVYFEMKNSFNFERNWKEYLLHMYEPQNLFKLTFFSLTIVWGIGFGLVIYFLGMSYQRLKIRDEIKMIEDEFQIALFRLADILSSGIPLETALEEVVQKYRQSKLQNSPMYMFFLTMINNIRKLGMTIEAAVFDRKYGVLLRYPSILIKDIMKILVSSAKKSSVILSVASRSISGFLLKVKNVETLLKEMLDEISAAIKLQANMIAPFICAIVAVMATFIIELLQKIAEFLTTIETTFLSGTFTGTTTSLSNMMSMINLEEVMPPTLFQLIVGIYMIEVVTILAYFLNGIRNGFDVTTRNVLIGKTLLGAIIFYSILVIIAIFITKEFIPILSVS